MRTIQETRLECLKLAHMLAQLKIIPIDTVTTRADTYYRWVADRQDEVAKASRTFSEKKYYGTSPF